MTQEDTFSQDRKIKPKLVSNNLTTSDLKTYLILVFGSLKNAGIRAGFSSDVRVHQILTGYKVPQDPEIIKRVCLAWNIDQVVLTQLFDRLRFNSQSAEKTKLEQHGEVRSSPEPIKEGKE